MLARYRKYAAHILKGGGEEGELAKPPPGGYDLKPMNEKHNSLSAAMQDNMDQRAEAAEMQEQINKQAGGGETADVEPGKAPPGTIEVEGSTVLDPEQNNTLTGIRELEMQASADTSLDGDPKKGGGRRRKKRKRKKKTKRKRWPPKRKSRRSKKRIGGEVHISSPKIKSIMKEKGYKKMHSVKQPLVWNPKAFTAKRSSISKSPGVKGVGLGYRELSEKSFNNLLKQGGKRKKRTRKNLVDKLFKLAGGKRKKTRRKRR